MNPFAKLFTGGAKELVSEVKDAVDEFHFSGEEKAELKHKFEELLLKHKAEQEKGITARWGSDMTSDSWLSKNIRPMSLAVMGIALILFTFLDTEMINIGVKQHWIDLWTTLAVTTFAAYFGSRGYEKGQEFKYKK